MPGILDPNAELSDVELAQAALVVDSLLLKGVGASDEARFVALELRARREFEASWEERAEDAVSRALAGLSGDEPVTEGDAKRILAKSASAFKGWADEVEPMIKAVTRQTYKLSKRQLSDRAMGKLEAIKPTPPPFVAKATASVSFNLIDEQAVAALEESQLYWVGEYYDRQLTEQLRAVVLDTMLNRGLSRAEAGKFLGPHLQRIFGLGDQSKRYFEGLAANVVTNARVQGAVRQMAEIGITSYEIINPIDERTCDRCRFMDGRTFETRHAIRVADALLAAETPEDVKRIHPWAADVEAMKRADKAGRLHLDFPIPPFHFRCRCTLDISEDAEFQPVSDE